MNHTIKYLILGLAVLGGLTACNKQLIEEPQASVNTHRVYFSSGTAQTKTGISVDENMMTPDWRKTAAANVHLFEIGSKGYSIGEDVTITPSEDNLTAHFSADFPTDMTIIVNPSKNAPTLTVSNEPNVGPYFYAAVVAKAAESAYIVPAVQHPDAETLIDPDADFLIGYSRKSYEAAHNFDEPVVDLYFDRPVALGRINISNFTEDDEIVKSVAIKAPGLSGSAAYSAVDFENASVTFTPDVVAEGETAALTLDYGNGAALAQDGTFSAYFVALPVKATVSEIVVTTDKWVYTKTVGKEITFSNTAFKNLKLDLAGAEKEAAAPAEIKWYKASMFEDGIDYLIVSAGQALKNNDGATAGVSVTDNEGVITLEAADPTIVWTATAHQEMTGDNGQGGVVAGHFTLTNDSKYLLRDSQEITLGDAIPSAKPKYAVWDYDGSYLKHESSETMTFYCYYDGGWATGYTQNGAAPGSSIKTVQIYTSRAPQELAFTPAASAEYDLATSEWTVAVPTLSGAQTSVTYSLSEDSNPAVATVDEDGTVHPLSRGTVTIVATATGNDQYQAASASYTLRVVDSSVTTNTYYKVTSTSDLSIGDKYLLVYEGGKKVFNPILDGNVFKKDEANALDAEITDNTIVSDSFEESHLTLESGYFLKVDKYGDYLYPNVASRRGVLSAESTASNALNITIGNNGIASIITKTGTYYLVWSTSSKYFSANTDVEGSYSTGICLYKLDDGRLPQSPSFSPSEVNYDMAGSAALVKPTLSNAFGNVTYSSSNEAIATVDSSTGDVTVKKKGNVEITASAAGNSQYKPGSANYTLKITNSSVTTPIWRKADAIEAGETYLIVSNGYALQNNGGSAAAVAVSVSDGVIEFDAPENAIFTATASSSNFTLQNDGQYMQRGGSSNNYVPTFSSSQGSYYQWTYDSTNEVVTAKGNNTYYVYYSTTNSKWSMNSSSADNRKAALYKLDDGSPKNQNLKFSETDVTYNMYGSPAFTAPTLSGAKTEVTYRSSVTSVATVNSSGEVAIQGEGTTIITANAPAGTVNGVSYNAGTASYTLTVINEASKTYSYLSGDPTDGGTYLIAGSETNSLLVCLFPDAPEKTWTSNNTSNTGQVLGQKQVGTNATAETITTSDSEIFDSEVVLIKSGSNWIIKVKKTGQYLAAPTKNYEITYTSDSASAAVHSASTPSSGKRNLKTGNYYFYHSGSAAGFTYRTTNTANLRLYELNENP